MTHQLPQGAGYAIVVGLGLVFAAAMILTTFILRRYQREIITSEEFSTAGRSVETGLIAAAVVSSWTWAATLLTSSTQAYKYGVSGPYFYAAGACVQVILFAFLAIKAKQKAPEAHTYLEIVKARYGGAVHGVFIFFAIVTNILVTSMLLTGGSATINDLTGMNTTACIFLLPLGVMVYTLFGGIKATFLTDYIHTIAIIVIIMTFAFTAYATSSKLGSPGKVWELVTAAGQAHPVSGNAEGSYLTMHSRSGGIFFVINIVGNFGTVFLDNGYWNKAIASSPASALPGYVLGGLSWFAIPWLTATTMGLACIALESDPSFPSYPQRLSSEDVSAGLVLPTAAVAIMGKGGAVATLFMVFMAVTSAMSAELIAVSSIVSYDIYKGYINPKASGKNIIVVSHASVIFFSVAMSGLSTGFWYAGISMTYLYLLMGVIISAAVVPASLTLLWKQQNAIAAGVSPVLGTILALMSWLVCTHSEYGEINVVTSSEDNPMLTGNVVALLSPLVFVPILTYIFKPQNFDWEILKNIKRVDETEEIEKAISSPEEDLESSEDAENANGEPEKLLPITSKMESLIKTMSTSHREIYRAKMEEEHLRIASKKAGYLCMFLAIALLVVWPMPMYGSSYIFSRKFFTGWVAVGIIWIFFSGFSVIIFPLFEGRNGIYTSLRGIYWDLSGQTHKLREWQESNPDKLHVVQSQVSMEARRSAQLMDADNIQELDEVLK
ncbi:urea active transporter [Brettanomyces nanus]|uniref:Urea active transporter n=1 Tax=Eeniella nana TaxID=13502 RepID=A0A875S2P5_EENNA|nr:urea active transporter [Brettanomyces nanus]QPG74615.1 urea active transporter [Brettanomyces nanus]